MKAIFILILTLCIGSVVVSQTPNQCVSIVDGKLYDPVTGQTFISKGVNFNLINFSYDNGQTFEFKPRHEYFPIGGSTCVGQTNCNAVIMSYFQYLKTNLGVNTLRIPMIEAYPTGGNCNASTFTFWIENATSYYPIQITDLKPLATYYKNILDLADQAGLKVILLLSGNGFECTNPIIKTIYNDYLDKTAEVCKDHKALLAYDLWNEPQLSNREIHTKAEICALSNERYDIIKNRDPNHLISIGNLVADAVQYSTDVFKADLFTFHAYPPMRWRSHTEPSGEVVLDENLDYNNTQRYIDGFNTLLKWIKNTCNKPFLFGEVGFRARRSNPSDIRMDGDLAAQAQYLDATFKSTINSGGLGYIWWQGYDLNWNTPDDPGQSDFGLIDPDAASNSFILKPAATTFKNIDPTLITGPAVEYPTTPNHYTNLLGYSGTPFSGTVINDENLPVADAVIEGWKMQPNAVNPAKDDYTNPSSTFSLPNTGQFLLNSVTPIGNPPDPLSTRLNTFRVSAIFHNYMYCGTYKTNLPALYCDGVIYQLNRQQVTDVTLNGLTWPSELAHVYTAPNNLYFNNMYLGITVGQSTNPPPPQKFTAGREIAITGNTSINPVVSAAEFYIDFDTDCSDDAYQRTADPNTKNKSLKNKAVTQSDPDSYQDENRIKTIFLNYDNDITSTQATVYPNPVTNGLLNIDCEIGITQIYLYNSMGQQVFAKAFEPGIEKNIVNLTKLIYGLYTLHITLPNGNKSIHQLIIE